MQFLLFYVDSRKAKNESADGEVKQLRRRRLPDHWIEACGPGVLGQEEQEQLAAS